MIGKITLLNRKAVDAYQHLEFETAQRILNEALDQSERDASNRWDHECGSGRDRRCRHDPSERAENGRLARPVEV